jgi:hypothetical protein
MPDYMTFLYIKPDYDDPSIQYLKLTEPIRDYAQSKGYQVIDLEGDSSKPEVVYKAIEEYDPYIVFSCGHGCTHVTTTQNYEDAFWVSPGCGEHSEINNQVDMLNGRVTFLLSCYCGANLVPAIFDAGGVSVTGFNDEFTWVVDTDYPITEDPFALTFYDVPNYYVSMLLDGEDPQKAYAKSKERYNTLIKTWEGWIKDNPNANATTRSRAYLTISLLEHDRDILTTVGQGFKLVSQPSGLNLMAVLLGGVVLTALFANISKETNP